jgi:hypothetical protein
MRAGMVSLDTSLDAQDVLRWEMFSMDMNVGVVVLIQSKGYPFQTAKDTFHKANTRIPCFQNFFSSWALSLSPLMLFFFSFFS